jgi:CHAD domain-containing protein
MGFRFQREESVAEGARRIATEELNSIIHDFEHATPATRDKSIHEARKSLKKLRAILRLMRNELGASYRTENRIFRQAGRTLSDLRDSASVIESFDTLEEKYKNEVPAFALQSVRQGLLERKRRAENEHHVAALLKDVAFSLQATARRVDSWPLSKDGFAALKPGVEDAYRKGKAAFQAAQKRPSTDNYHDWRKRVKDHWYHIRLLENLWTEVFQGYEAVLKEVETCLGDGGLLVISYQ